MVEECFKSLLGTFVFFVLQILYVFIDFLIYRSKRTEARGILDYLEQKFLHRSNSRSRSRDTIPVPVRSSIDPPRESYSECVREECSNAEE